ncbi:MAG: aldo/keto reductase [Planctomycetaceae bacterium]
MEYVKLPEVASPVSRVGLGGCPLGGHGWGEVDDRNSVEAVRRAVDGGVNLFDTADIYGLGHSEQILSEALGYRRHDLVIASKFGVRRTSEGKTLFDNSPEWLDEALTGSLKRLRLDCIPLYYLHWPDGKTPIEAAVEAMDAQRRAGRIGAIALSNVTADELNLACGVARISAVQVQYSLVDRVAAEALAATARRHGVPLITWGSLAQGLLTGKYDEHSRFDASDRRSRYENFTGEKFQLNLRTVTKLKQIAPQYRRSPGQVAIRWLLDTPSVGAVLFGAKHPNQVEENLGATDWHLSTEHYLRLDGGLMESQAAA